MTHTRTYQGHELPPAGKYQIDPAHSTVEFVSRHLMVAKVRGRFDQFSGVFEVADDPTRSSVEVAIQAASVNTNQEQRDQDLRSEGFLLTEENPEITFTSTDVRLEGDTWKVAGDLSIRGETNPVTLEVEFLGFMKDPFGQEKAIFSAETTINRHDFKVSWNAPLEAGGFLVGDEVKIELQVQGIRQ
ncbi:MAG: YceI family protein [Acidimicrobiia bacterium]